jgi:chloramphenicol-sensitive protein RarD
VSGISRNAAVPVNHTDSGARTGLVCGISAYTMWGVFPLYFRAVSDVPPWIVLCHRIVWSALFLAGLVSIRREWKLIWCALRRRRNVLLLSAGAVLIALNWLLFIYAVASKQVLQASLGYFINPLLSIALGMIFLGERLRKWQWLAVGTAATALVLLALRGGGFPWVAISLACTFGFYGLVRKTVDINSLHGLLVESAILFPPALVVLIVLQVTGIATVPRATLGILSLSGVITAVPLLLFGAALRQLKLSTIGFLQYIGPTLQFLVATCLFHEALDPAKVGSFALCWVAIGIYVLDSALNRKPQIVADEPE